eukprot:gnl/TRDRNA2_/TRDRNA2_132160_c0_seq1.p1 gnl/TRDRNA2_/TRDRNA2_132160_c0~~gnl/TRDRNA2_/TRDRNA2_132160_c0_seq1.p1  ORF type:complete len:745 (+),score=74.99 gnl/TRDRNA2_/TRDRNA2_132160_c0_seq1:18-2252(+)
MPPSFEDRRMVQAIAPKDILSASQEPAGNERYKQSLKPATASSEHDLSSIEENEEVEEYMSVAQHGSTGVVTTADTVKDDRYKFDITANTDSVKFEIGLVVMKVLNILICLFYARGLWIWEAPGPDNNLAPAGTSACSAVLHSIVALMRQAVPRQPALASLISVFVLWVDAVLNALCSHWVQHLWVDSIGLLGKANQPPESALMRADDMGHVALVAAVCYSIMFLMPFKYGMLGAPLGLVLYSLLVIWGKTGSASYRDHGHHDEQWDNMMILEPFLLVLSYCMGAVSKRITETSRWMLFQELESQRRLTLQEKIGRCEAEFARDFSSAGSRPEISGNRSAASFVLHNVMRTAPAGDAQPCTKRSPRQPSVRSAPAVYPVSSTLPPHGCGVSQAPCGQGGADCLPGDATVRVENKVESVPLRQVKKGQRILCHDHVGDCLRYVEVTEAAVAAPEDANWVDVGLADGRNLTMTADHPVQVTDLHRGSALDSNWIRAGDLCAGLHAVLVVRVERIIVERVQPLSGQLPMDRVGVSVMQPARNSIMVAPPSGCGHGAGMAAVGSVVCEAAPQLQTRHTFLELPTHSEPKLKRSASAPPNLFRESANERAVVHIAKTNGSDGESLSFLNSTQSSSKSSAGSGALAVDANENVLLGGTMPGRPAVSLIEFSQVPRHHNTKAIMSCGSAAHTAGGPCTPCEWLQRGRLCKYGWNCPYCHYIEEHATYRKARGAKKQTSMELSKARSTRVHL